MMKPHPFTLKAAVLLAAFALPAPVAAYDIVPSTRGTYDIQPASGPGKGRRGMGGGDAPQGLDPEVRDAFLARRATPEAMDARGLMLTGLRPVYPDGLDCQTADSFFASGTRGNGSLRSQRYYEGRHGGMDIPAEGVAVIAMADGEVIEKSEGDGIGGIRIVLRHAPADTGLDVWTFTEYKHLKDIPDQALHSRVRQGEPLGIAWNTGTTSGRAYGPDGHYHLHLSVWYNATGEVHHTKFMPVPKDGRWADPLALLRGGPLNSTAVEALTDTDKQVRFAYRTAEGATHPRGAKIVWPFVCR